MLEILRRLRLGAFGPAGLIGIVLLLCAAIAYATLVMPRIAQRDALAERLHDAAPASGAAEDSGDVEARLLAFQRALPTTASVPQWLARVRTAALQSGLALRSADYKLERSSDSSVLRYRITLPVAGSYGQVRSFIGTVLSEVPAVAVDDVQLKREGATSRVLDARIRLTLFIAAE